MAPTAPALSRRSLRGSQPATHVGPGVHFTSPLRARDKAKKRLLVGIGRAATISGLRSRLADLLADDLRDPPSVDDGQDHTEPVDEPMGEAGENEWVDVDTEPPPAAPSVPRPRPGLAAAERLNLSWNILLSTLEGPSAQYSRSSYGQHPSIIPSNIHYRCVASCGFPVKVQVRCLYISHHLLVDVTTCSCMSVATLLVQHGVFPASPTKVQTGISIDLLEVYRALFERSCDAVTALAAALQTIYERRGFRVYTQKNPGHRATDPFRKLLGQAVLWYSNLRVRMRGKVDAALAAAELSLDPPAPVPAGAETASPAPPVPETTPASGSSPATSPISIDERDDTPPPPPTLPLRPPSLPPTPLSSTPPPPTSPPPSSSPPPTSPLPPTPPPSTSTPPTSPPLLTPGRAARVLRERCPACFGLEEWGRPLRDGGDVQFGADGCFSFRHLRSAGDGPISYDPSYFISKEKVARVQERITAARNKKPATFKPAIPQEALDACQESWNAANEKKQKTDTKHFDAGGVFVLTCRHSQVLFLCDIDTPGEQQKYIVAGLEEINSLLPPQATILQAYDVGCVTDHSFNLFPILTDGFRERVSFIINAMHAFGHRWVCQIVYSPRFRDGVGLSDMEGVERFWSRIRKLITLTRTQWNSRRLWTIDQYTSFVNQEGLEGLGAWLNRQETKNLTKKRAAAVKTLVQCGISEAELRSQWAAQKTAQMSARSHAPLRLQRNLDKVLKLQDQIDTVEKSIADAKQSLTAGNASASTLDQLRRLQATHEILGSQAEALYASLNIHTSFPELRDLPLDFVRTLIIMRDLKINIRGRAIESFYEWETLDRAVAGRREPLGTKLHQATQKTISKRAPALLKAINKFNSHCAKLERLRPPGCNIPIPSPLPTKLQPLREDASLHEDVWITPTEGEIPRWLDDPDIRDGVRSLHLLARCQEEARRLEMERQNLARWLAHEVAVVEQANECNEDECVELPLRLRLQALQDLESAWRLPQQVQFARFLQSAPSASLSTTTTTTASTSAGAAGTFSTTAHTPSSISTSTLIASTSAVFTSSVSTGASDISSARGSMSARARAFTSARTPTSSFMSTSVATRASGPNPLSAPEADEDSEFEELESNAIPTLEELDVGDISDMDEPLIIQDVTDQANSDDEEDSSSFDTGSSKVQIVWECPTGLHVNSGFLSVPRVVVGLHGRQTMEVLMPDLARLTSLTGRLNGDILNGAAAALLNLFEGPTSLHTPSAATCALLNTHLSHTRYWEKAIWIVPIHRPKEEHWVLAVAAVQENRLFFFDSLGNKSGWRQDIKDIMLLIKRMVFISGRQGHRLYISTEDVTWIAQPLWPERTALQSNGHDCGVWVLCMIAAVLRGFHTTNITEALMVTVRQLLTDNILTLPFQTARRRS